MDALSQWWGNAGCTPSQPGDVTFSAWEHNPGALTAEREEGEEDGMSDEQVGGSVPPTFQGGGAGDRTATVCVVMPSFHLQSAHSAPGGSLKET